MGKYGEGLSSHHYTIDAIISIEQGLKYVDVDCKEATSLDLNTACS
jgi:hypothetical protein